MEERDEERKRCHELSALLDDVRNREGKHVADFDSINHRLGEAQEEVTKKDERIHELEDEIQEWRRKMLTYQESSTEESVFEAVSKNMLSSIPVFSLVSYLILRNPFPGRYVTY